MKSSYIKIRPKTLINISRIVTIHYYEFGPNFVFQGESHDFWEFNYIDKGQMVVTVGGNEYLLKSGELVGVAIVSNLPHREDHRFIAGALADYLKIDNLPII